MNDDIFSHKKYWDIESIFDRYSLKAYINVIVKYFRIFWTTYILKKMYRLARACGAIYPKLYLNLHPIETTFYCKKINFCTHPLYMSTDAWLLIHPVYANRYQTIYLPSDSLCLIICKCDTHNIACIYVYLSITKESLTNKNTKIKQLHVRLRIQPCFTFLFMKSHGIHGCSYLWAFS